MAEFNAPNASPVPVWLEERSVMPAHNARASMPSTECLRYGATKSQSTKHRQVSASRCAHNLDNDEPRSIACHYLVGCDGGRSMVRKAIGAKFSGTTEIERVQSTCIRSPGLMTLLRGKPAWMYLALNPRRCGTVIAVDGRETWLIHNALRNGRPRPIQLIAVGPSAPSSALNRTSATRSSRKRTGLAAAWWHTAFVTGACSSVATRPMCGCPRAATV
jgi:hypothetical protein